MDESAVKTARAFIEAFERGDENTAKEHFDKLTSVSEQRLFKEIGKLTRELHDTLNTFHLDNRITLLAAHEIPDAKDRLEYVVKMTAEAANKTMDAVEKGIELSSVVESEAKDLNARWQEVHNNSLSGADFRELCDATQKHMQSTSESTVKLNSFLQEALLAQDFQDLTGQVINRVIKLVQDVEQSLVETIKMFGSMQDYETAVASERKKEEGSTGPTIKQDTPDTVSGQDEVDDLLSSLGF